MKFKPNKWNYVCLLSTHFRRKRERERERERKGETKQIESARTRKNAEKIRWFGVQEKCKDWYFARLALNQTNKTSGSSEVSLSSHTKSDC